MLAANPSATASGAADPASLEQIFQSHHGKVFGAAFRVTGSAQDAEDVLQTVFLRLLRRQHEIDLSPNPGSYLYRAAVNAALDLLRARGKARSVPLDELSVPPEGGSEGSADRQQQDREIRRQLRQALLTLSPKSAQIFSLRYLEGLDNREIAKSFGMSQTAVAVSLHRARKQVQKELRSYLREVTDHA